MIVLGSEALGSDRSGRWSFHICNYCSETSERDKISLTLPTHSRKKGPYEPGSVLSNRESINTLILKLTTYKRLRNHLLLVRSHQSIAFDSNNLNRLITAKRHRLKGRWSRVLKIRETENNMQSW